MDPFARHFYIDSDGRLRESHPGDGFPFVMAILLGIFALLQQVYLWMQAHYWFVGTLASFAFITWVGWAKLVHENKVETNFLGKLRGFLSLLIIAGLFNMSFTGFTKASNERELRAAIQGHWKQVDANTAIKLSDTKLVIESQETNRTVDLDYRAEVFGQGQLLLHCTGKQYPRDKPSKTEPVSVSYQCFFDGERLCFIETSSRDQFVFDKID